MEDMLGMNDCLTSRPSRALVVSQLAIVLNTRTTTSFKLRHKTNTTFASQNHISSRSHHLPLVLHARTTIIDTKPLRHHRPFAVAPRPPTLVCAYGLSNQNSHTGTPENRLHGRQVAPMYIAWPSYWYSSRTPSLLPLSCLDDMY